MSEEKLVFIKFNITTEGERSFHRYAMATLTLRADEVAKSKFIKEMAMENGMIVVTVAPDEDFPIPETELDQDILKQIEEATRMIEWDSFAKESMKAAVAHAHAEKEKKDEH